MTVADAPTERTTPPLAPAPEVDRLRVLVLTNMFPTAAEPWFGVFVSDQTADLRDAGVDAEVLAFDARSSRRSYLTAARRLHHALRHARFDIVHAHYGLAGAIAATQRRVPVVTTFHGTDALARSERPISWVVARRTRPIVVAPVVADSLGLRGAAVIPCAVDTELFALVDRAEARRLLGWPADGAYVLFPAARDDPTKRPKRSDLFDAAMRHVRRRVPGVRDVSLDGLSRTQVAAAMSAADVMLMTSDREGSPVTVKESLACATPVVSVSVGDVAEVIGGLPGCAITARDPAALAAAVLRALETPRSPALRDRALTYGRGATAARIIDVYHRALAGGTA
ncbi:MAG TPA: glycosyltransferase [Gaiellales bacterium]|nr:glycosyltransferase [Gaiellales bacterium]